MDEIDGLQDLAKSLDSNFGNEVSVMKLTPETIAEIENTGLEICQQIRGNGERCDAVLIAEDGGRFPVHKVILSLCSPYFIALFTSRLNGQLRREFTIPGVKADMLSLIIDYAYAGEVEITEENVTSLLAEAGQFCVNGLFQDCTNFLIERMDVENCIGFGQFARNYFAVDLQKTVHWYLREHFVEVVEQSEEFLELSLEDVCMFLISDRINVRGEEIIWEAGIRWIDYMADERKQHIESILRCVRLGLLDSEYFMQKVKNHCYVQNNERCRKLVIEAMKFLWDLENISQRMTEIETPSLALPRVPYSILFTIGGWSGGSPTDVIETYDPKADRWIKLDVSGSLGARAYHKLAVIGKDIYVIGGFNGHEYFSDCRRFNVETKQWSLMAPMNRRRCYVNVACLNNVIYAIGGYDGQRRQNTAERYDIERNQWTYISPMSVPRSDADATSLDGLIYVVGGFSGSECLSSGEYYDPATDQWTLLSPMSQARSGVSIIAHHGCIFALGGFNGITRLQSGEKYDPQTDEWTPIPEMTSQRSNFAIEVLEDMIIVMGGFNGMMTICSVECFDDLENEWYDATSMNITRSALAACVISGLPHVDDYIYKDRKSVLEDKRQKMISHHAKQVVFRARYNNLIDAEDAARVEEIDDIE